MHTRPSVSSTIRFADFELDLRTGDLRRGAIALKLQPQPAKVLCYLSGRPGEVVTRQELAEQVWGSETFVDFEQGLNFAIRQIRTVLEDDAESPHFVQTVPKRGYRFVAEIENQPGPNEKATLSAQSRGRDDTAKKGTTHKPLVALGAVALFIVVAFAVWRWTITQKATKISSQAIQSIAVLPLVNLSSDPAQEYFSDGLTDELITELAKTGMLRVISRTSVIGYKGTRKHTPEIARELHVDAIVEGTVEHAGNRVRVRAQLINGATDEHLWAEECA